MFVAVAGSSCRRSGSGAPADPIIRIRSELQAGGGAHHRCPAGVDGGDDLFGVDALQVDRGGAEVGGAELALDDVERDASRARSTAWAWRSWCGAKRRRMPAWAASRRKSTRTLALDQGRPRVGPAMTQNSGPTGSSRRTATKRERMKPGAPLTLMRGGRA